MNNGRIAIERLEAMSNSLKRAKETVDKELSNIESYDDYSSEYLERLREFNDKTSELEDILRERL